MELLFIGFLALAGIGAASVKQDYDDKAKYRIGKETRIIEQTREVFYSEKELKAWGEQ